MYAFRQIYIVDIILSNTVSVNSRTYFEGSQVLVQPFSTWQTDSALVQDKHGLCVSLVLMIPQVLSIFQVQEQAAYHPIK